jgi:hypothetical protein
VVAVPAARAEALFALAATALFAAATAAALGVRAFEARFELPHGRISLRLDQFCRSISSTC